MRHLITLILILLAIGAPQVICAQQVTFRSADIVQLAGTIVTEAHRTNQLPSSYLVMTADGVTETTINAANACELLVRTVLGWKESKTGLPDTVQLSMSDLQGPSYDQKLEPEPGTADIHLPVTFIDSTLPSVLDLAEKFNHKLTRQFTFKPMHAVTYQITMAQFVVALATLLETGVHNSKEHKPFPKEVVIPLVTSPHDWGDVSHPIEVAGAPTAAPEATSDVRVCLNGAEVTERSHAIVRGNATAPYCGTLHIDLIGVGPIASVKLLIDQEEVAAFTGPGPHRYELNSMLLTDAAHILTAQVTDTNDAKYTSIFSFNISNGRHSGFNPVQMATVGLDATPGK